MSGESFDGDFMIGAAMAGPFAVFGATVAARHWPATMAFYCAVLAAPVVALSIGYFPIALLRRSHAVEAASTLRPVGAT
ncbi:hypothetical protein [Nocardia sp. NPDC049526]|uniref:hypothetical protein n=1 Tax=Nocardia sp. NPDC049526 TaxID=3364316 RepID=UPI0037A5E4A5